MNNSQQSACFVKITIDSEDPSGAPIHSDSGFVNGSTLIVHPSFHGQEADSCLRPGEFGSFEVTTTLKSAPASLTTHLTWEGGEIADPALNLFVEGEITQGIDSFGNRLLSGTVRNPSASGVHSARIIFAAVHSGRVAETEVAFITGSTCDADRVTSSCLLPGAAGSFSVSLNLPPSEVDGYYYKINYLLN